MLPQDYYYLLKQLNYTVFIDRLKYLTLKNACV
jgi:hypothetical protein